ncbi:MAG: N(4)-(beta-N-acetylglucosaminyl)-L-asparaginase [Acidobacteriota bacterium]|nr:N(4)-(beta-N-acetylglucosaminyl)-L-asparaginase [Acidobacteriota bacterium]
MTAHDAAGRRPAEGGSPGIVTGRQARPVVVASANGNQFRNGGPLTCVEQAFALLAGGADPLDAVIAGVNIVELDPGDSSVGYGGLPNADGVVQLDASCMHGPRRRAAGVVALEGVRTPSLVARALLERTNHRMLAGAGAQAFARAIGFPIEDDLNSPRSRGLWLEWKRRMAAIETADPIARMEAGYRVGQQMLVEGLIDVNHYYGTINCSAVNARGEICGVTTTSGLAWKIPGRVGDSPVLGAGLYVDGEVGAAGSTGHGESNLYALSSFLIVEEMRRGAHPKDAGLEALRRVRANTVDPALLDAQGRPAFNVKYYIVNARGEHAGVAMYGGPQVNYAVCTGHGAETRPCEALFDEELTLTAAP